jgi:hypothetical protein
MTQLHTKQIKLTAFRDSYFADDSKPCLATLKNHILAGQLSGKKLGGHWYVTVTGWGEPIYYGEPANCPAPAPTSTGNLIADRILKLAVA